MNYKLCGTPHGKKPTTDELDKHWKKHHNWYWNQTERKHHKMHC